MKNVIALLSLALGCLGCTQAAINTSQTRFIDKNSGTFFNTVTLRNQTDDDFLYLAVCALSLPSDPDVSTLFSSTNETITRTQYLVRKNRWQRMYERQLNTAYGPRDFWWVETIVPKREERTITIMTGALRGEKYVLVCELRRKKLPDEIKERGLE